MIMYSEKLDLTEYSSFYDDFSGRKTEKDYSKDFGYRNRRNYPEKSHSQHSFSSSSNYRDSPRRLEDYNYHRQARGFDDQRTQRFSKLYYGPLRSSKDCRIENRRDSPERMHHLKSNSYSTSLSRSGSPSCGAADHLYRTGTYTPDGKRIYICHECREAYREQPKHRDRLQITVKRSFTNEDESNLTMKSEIYHCHKNEDTKKPSFTKKDENILVIKPEKYHLHKNEVTDKPPFTKEDEKMLAIKSEKYLHENEDTDKPSFTKEGKEVIAIKSEKIHRHKNKDTKKRKNVIPAVVDLGNEIPPKKKKNKSPAIIDLDNEIHKEKLKNKIPAIIDLDNEIHKEKLKNKIPAIIDLDNEIHTKKRKNKICAITDLEKELQTFRCSAKVVQSEKMTEKKLLSKKRNESRKCAEKSEYKHECKKHKTEGQSRKKKSTTDVEIITLESTNPIPIEAKKIDDLEIVEEFSNKSSEIGDISLQNQKQHKHVVQNHDTSSDILEISVDDIEFNEFIVKEGISNEIESNIQQNTTGHEAGNKISKCNITKSTGLSELQSARIAAILSMIEKTATSPHRTQNIELADHKVSHLTFRQQ